MLHLVLYTVPIKLTQNEEAGTALSSKQSVCPGATTENLPVLQAWPEGLGTVRIKHCHVSNQALMLSVLALTFPCKLPFF